MNILEGSVRSGKTYVSLILWWVYVNMWDKDSGAAFLMCGKTLQTLKRNVLEPMETLFSGEDFSFSIGKKQANIRGRKIYLEGAGDVRSENKIRGLTLAGAYCDELSLYSEEFFSMLMTRLSARGAKLIATTNPDHPAHWLKRKFLDNGSIKSDLLDIKFTLTDNDFLEPEYVASLMREYTGVFRERYILGLWTAAEGRVYENFSKENAVIKPEQLANVPLVLSVIGVDYGGNKSASVFCLVGFDRGFRNVYVLDEYYDGKNRNAEHLIGAFCERVSDWRERCVTTRYAYCDSAEQLLIKSFRQAVAGVIEVKNALKKPINTRIAMTNRLLSANRLHILNTCTHLISALECAVWDSSHQADSRLDDGTSDIDSLDAFEYAIERYEKELFLQNRNLL